MVHQTICWRQLLTLFCCHMSAPLCMICKSFIALWTKVSWCLVMFLLVAFKEPLVWCLVVTQGTALHHTFMYLHMLRKFLGTELAMTTAWMYTYVVFYPFVCNFVNCQIRFKIETFTTSAMEAWFGMGLHVPD